MDGFTKYHANSPHSLDAIGRGMMKKLHPLEVRIPDCLCSFSGDQLPKLPARRLKTKDGRTVQGAGRGGQPSVSSTSHSYLSRERLIGRSLDAKKMDIKEGKGFILEKFLGQQAHNFNVKTKNTFSQSSGHSQRTCPPRVQTNHSEEWPGLERMETGSNAHAVDSIGRTINKDRNKPMRDNHQAESLSSASVGYICRSHSEELLDSSAKSDKPLEERNLEFKPNRTCELDPSEGKGTHSYVENNCTYNIASTVEAIKSGNIEGNALESKSEESSPLERSNERGKNARDTGQDTGKTEVSLSTLSKGISKTNEKARDTGQDTGETEVSLRTLSKGISKTNENARETGQDTGETEVSLSTLSKGISKTNENARDTGQDTGETEVSLSTLSKGISKTNENARDTGQDTGETEVSLSTLSKEISTTNENARDTGQDTGETNDQLGEEIFTDDSKEPSQTEISNSAGTENEVNYRLLGKQEEFEAGDVLPLSGPNVLQVEGLPEEIKNEDVSDLFLSCGMVTACKVLRDADTKLCIGIAYVRLEESSACAMAVSSFNEEPSPFTEENEISCKDCPITHSSTITFNPIGHSVYCKPCTYKSKERHLLYSTCPLLCNQILCPDIFTNSGKQEFYEDDKAPILIVRHFTISS